MAIIDTLTESNFIDRLRACRPLNFSYEGASALYEYLEQLSDDIGEPIEFDPVGLCCEYAEYANLEELQEDYEHIETLEDLESETTVIMIDESSFIIAQF